MILSAIILLLLLLYLLAHSFLKHIPTDSPRSDAYKQACLIKDFTFWSTPSKMHPICQEKSRMKDVGVLLSALVKKFIKSGSQTYPLVNSVLLMHLFSAILLYLIGTILWGTSIAIILFCIYLFNAWSIQVILLAGLQIVGQMLLLLALYSFLLLKSYELIMFGSIVAGLFFGSLFFSSASSRKYILVFLVSIIYFNIELITHGFSSEYQYVLLSIGLALFSLSIIGILFKRKILIKTHALWARLRKSTITNLNIENKAQTIQLPLEICLLLAVSIISSSFMTFSFLKNVFLPLLSGTLACFIYFLRPDYIYNLWMYSAYANVPNAGRFILYKDFLKSKKINISSGWRTSRSGFHWLLKLILLYELPLFVLLAMLFTISLSTNTIPKLTLGLILSYSFLPALWGEITRGPQIGRSYYTTLITMLLGSGELLHRTNAINNYLTIIIILTIASVAYSLIIIIRDIYPSRFAAYYLHLFLSQNKISQFYTYKSKYNEALVDAMIVDWPHYKIEYIKSLQEVKGGFVVIPGRSPKAFNMESCAEAINLTGDVTGDLSIKDYEKIKPYIIKEIKTVGSSHFWVQESEVTSLRHLVIGDIKASDRKLSNALVLKIP